MEYNRRSVEENRTKKMKTKIIVATHKQYEMPDEDIYLPLHVGAACTDKDFGYCKDNTGDNISAKNPYFCELTGLYWAWKNLDCDYLGMAHYRRHFTVVSGNGYKMSKMSPEEEIKLVLSGKQAQVLLKKYPIVLPRKRKYYIETLYSHYAHSHYGKHLDMTREIIAEKYPEYLKIFDKTLRQRSGYMFNMYVMRKDLSDAYCEWLFDILFELESRMDVERLSVFQGRLYGRVSEIIFNVWLNYQIAEKHYAYREIGCMHMESINWLKKGGAFLKAKFLHQKYSGSFREKV